MKEFRLAVRTSETALAQSLRDLQPDAPCKIDVASQRSVPGMSTSEVVLNIVISIGTGIPVGIVSSWLFEKLHVGKQSRLYDDDEKIIASIRQLEAKIELILHNGKD